MTYDDTRLFVQAALAQIFHSHLIWQVSLAKMENQDTHFSFVTFLQTSRKKINNRVQ